MELSMNVDPKSIKKGLVNDRNPRVSIDWKLENKIKNGQIDRFEVSDLQLILQGNQPPIVAQGNWCFLLIELPYGIYINFIESIVAYSRKIIIIE
jgi:hypothetical protein